MAHRSAPTAGSINTTQGLGIFERSDREDVASGDRGKFLLNGPEHSDKGRGVRLRDEERLHGVRRFTRKELVPKTTARRDGHSANKLRQAD